MRIARPTHMRKCPCRRTAIAGLPTTRRKSRDAVRGKDARADKDAKDDKDARDEKTAKDTKDTHVGIPEMDNREWRPLPPASPSSVSCLVIREGRERSSARLSPPPTRNLLK